MAERSAAMAGLISGEDMASRLFSLSAKEKPRPSGRGLNLSARTQAVTQRSVPLAEQPEQQREQVDEVQVQRQRTGNGGAPRHVTPLPGIAAAGVVLQPLGLPGGEAREHHTTYRRD